jgi:hypothetical protein
VSRAGAAVGLSRAGAAFWIGLALLLPLALGRAAAGHWTPPDTIIGELNGDAGRAAGVERAERDAKVARLLVIRVGPEWYARTAAARKAQAADWLGRWRASVEQGIVAVLDARTARPVVEFGPRGTVEAVEQAPP